MLPPIRPNPIIASCIAAALLPLEGHRLIGSQQNSTERAAGIGLGHLMGGHTGLYVIMGVCGSGKTTVGALLARALDIAFVDGDELHPPENVRRMAAGIPLTDDDRHGWLLAIAARLRAARRAGTGLVVSCSALKRRYRDLLRGDGAADVRFVLLSGSRELLAQRLAQRRGHFMPPALLDSQLAILEEPAPDEQFWVCDIRDTPETIVSDLLARMT
jgi:gluconokinase